MNSPQQTGASDSWALWSQSIGGEWEGFIAKGADQETAWILTLRFG
jgi:hypothetical protein